MIIFFKKIDFYKIFCMTSLCSMLLIIAIIKLPHYYQIPTVTASFKGCEEYGPEYKIGPSLKDQGPILVCSFVDSTGYKHLVAGSSKDTFGKMIIEPVNKSFVINDSRYEDVIGSIAIFTAFIFYSSFILTIAMTPVAIARKIDNKIKECSFEHIDA